MPLDKYSFMMDTDSYLFSRVPEEIVIRFGLRGHAAYASLRKAKYFHSERPVEIQGSEQTADAHLLPVSCRICTQK